MNSAAGIGARTGQGFIPYLRVLLVLHLHLALRGGIIDVLPRVLGKHLELNGVVGAFCVSDDGERYRRNTRPRQPPKFTQPLNCHVVGIIRS